jgi:hypothetical protein
VTATDQLLIVAQRYTAGVTDRETAQAQARLIIERSGRSPESAALDLAAEVARTKAKMAALQRSGG